MKKKGRYFTKEKKDEAQKEQKDTRTYFRKLMLYVAIFLGAVAIWIMVNTKGTTYLTSGMVKKSGKTTYYWNDQRLNIN